MGLITLVQPDEQFWLLVAVDDADPTEVKHKILDDHEPTDAELDGTWTGIKCRRMAADWFEDVKTRHTRWASDRTGRYEQTNWQAYRKEIIRHIVVDWRGIKGGPACSDENKLKLPQAVQLLVIGQSSGLVTTPDRGEMQKNS